MVRNALIMAAGKGERMLPITKYIPKAMALYKDKTLIERSISILKGYGFNVHVTIGHKGNMLCQHILQKGISSIIDTNGQGNCWWIYNSLLKHINEPVVVSTCDIILDIDFNKILLEYNELNRPSCLIVPVKVKSGVDGDCVVCENKKVISIGRHIASDIYCSGVQIINPFKINLKTTQSDNFSDLWNQLIKNGDIFCSENYPRTWSSIDTVEQLQCLNDE